MPSLPGCVSEGQTREEALANVREAIEAWIEAAKGLGREIQPSPETQRFPLSSGSKGIP